MRKHHHPAQSPAPPLVEKNQLEEWILEENEDYMVINKPGWLVCHPSKNGPWSSLVGAVRESRNLDRIHLVSRLDRETSGLVILAKNHRTASRLQVAFSKRNTHKQYLAILSGKLEQERSTESNLVPDKASPVFVQQKVSFGGHGKLARTQFKPIRPWGRDSLVEVIPITGRKHQIRVHAEWLGHPVIGDKIYGGDPTHYLEFIESGWTDRLERELIYPRQALHAHRIKVWGDDFSFEWEAPCPFSEEGFDYPSTGS